MIAITEEPIATIAGEETGTAAPQEETPHEHAHQMVLRSEGLVKQYGKRTVVNGVSFDVKQGEIVGLLGPNGAGKTTLFNCICGLLDITEGDVVFCGESVKGLPPYKMAGKGIARAFQIVKPFGNMTTLQNVMVGAFCKTDHYGEAEKLAM